MNFSVDDKVWFSPGPGCSIPRGRYRAWIAALNGVRYTVCVLGPNSQVWLPVDVPDEWLEKRE